MQFYFEMWQYKPYYILYNSLLGWKCGFAFYHRHFARAHITVTVTTTDCDSVSSSIRCSRAVCAYDNGKSQFPHLKKWMRLVPNANSPWWDQHCNRDRDRDRVSCFITKHSQCLQSDHIPQDSKTCVRGCDERQKHDNSLGFIYLCNFFFCRAYVFVLSLPSLHR